MEPGPGRRVDTDQGYARCSRPCTLAGNRWPELGGRGFRHPQNTGVGYPFLVASNEWRRSRRAFGEAARWFARSTAAGQGRWDELALGEWTVRDLVGHTSRAILTVEAYLGMPASVVEVTSPVDYFRLVLASTGAPGAVAQRGRDAGAALGADPPSAVGEIAERVLARVHSASGDEMLTTPVGGMRLADYLPTRTFELTVHTCDLAVALDAPLDAPAVATAQSLELVGELASRSGLAAPLLLAATGRRPLPAGFSVL